MRLVSEELSFHNNWFPWNKFAILFLFSMVTCSQLKSHLASDCALQPMKTTFNQNFVRKDGERRGAFLIATHLFFFIHDVLYAHIRQHKKILCCTKTVVSTKKIFHIEVNVAQWNYVRQRKICYGDKKNYDTQKKIHGDSICLVLHRKRNTCLQKMVPVAYKYMLNWLKKFCIARKII